jgi:hypothetical protein
MHTENCCHLKPRWVKCTGYQLANQCHSKTRSTNVRCVLCDGKHPENYREYTDYKELPSLRVKQYPPPALIKPTLQTQSHRLLVAAIVVPSPPILSPR